jgi:gluconolactonase
LRTAAAGNYTGVVDQQELPTNVYRLDKAGRLTVVTGDVDRPDGLAFSPDEKKLYFIEDGATPQVILVYDVVDDGTKLAGRRTFVTVDHRGVADGLRLDIDGNLWCGWGGGAGNDGVMVFNSVGKAIGRIDLPERSANVCFGGVSAQPSVHGSKSFTLRGIPSHPGRRWRLSRNRRLRHAA